jgi:hypothetical protein
MKPGERPIIFSAQMVRALLAGTKTMTRRVVKPQPPDAWAVPPVTVFDGRWTSNGCVSELRCPYGQRGDRLWVRETWCDPCGDQQPVYRANLADSKIADAAQINRIARGIVAARPWRSSRYMPRWASRITLEITDVRVERLQHISEVDAWAEGVLPPGHSVTRYEGEGIDLYRCLWDSLHAVIGETWGHNPWVWCLTFRRIR